MQRARVAIVCSALPSPSETFIRSHIEGLDPDCVVHEWYPKCDGAHVWGGGARAYYKLRRLLARETTHAQMTAGYVRVFRTRRTDVVLAEYGDVGVQVLDACTRLKLPLVVHFHGYDAAQSAIVERHRADYERMFSFAARIVVVSRRMEGDLLALGCPGEKICYNPYGVDAKKFVGSSPHLAPARFIAVGRLIEKKAPLATLAAFARVLEKVPTARLRMIGDGPLRPACEEMIWQLKLQNAVELLGFQGPEVVATEMRLARAFVQHSVHARSGDAEGTPVAIIEAGASGLPVVSTRHAGIPDVVIEGETGILVDEGDVGGMAAAMLALAQQPERARTLGAAAQRRVSSMFSMEDRLRRLRQVLDSAALGILEPVGHEQSQAAAAC
jgi:colanic acid/amylovoran biosynthesis glycosyltransferase